MLIRLVWLILLTATTACCAQDNPSKGPAKDPRSHGSSRAQNDYRTILLERTEAEASGLSAGMRAWVLLQVARAHEHTDRPKALNLLEQALNASRAVDDDRKNRQREEALTRLMTGRAGLSFQARLQQKILEYMVLIAPDRADEWLEQVDGKTRAAALSSLLARYESDRRPDRAINLLERIAMEDEMPYDGAIRVMSRLTEADQAAEIQELFVKSLGSYRDHAPHDGGGVDAFPALVVKFWNRVPKSVAREAVDEILKQAERSNGSSGNATASFSIVSQGKDGATFDSLYKYRLFQLMPVLHQIDESAAREYLQKDPQLAHDVEQYPAGAASMFAIPGEKAAEGQANSKFSFSLRGSSGDFNGAMSEIPHAERLVSDAQEGHGEEVIDVVNNIHNLNIRAQCYEGIARVTKKRDPAVAKRSLERMLDVTQSLELSSQMHYYVAASEIYLQLKDMSAAKASIQAGLGLADKLYRYDSNPENPNRAVKVFWPSTNAYSRLLRQATEISPYWASSLLKQIEDKEIRVAAETSIMGALFKLQPDGNTVIISNNDHNSVSNEP